MMQVTETTINDYDNLTVTMPMNRADAISEKFARYLLEMAKSRETVILDEDGTMMYVSYVKMCIRDSDWRVSLPV